MATQCKRPTTLTEENTSRRVSSPSACRTGAHYLPKQTSLLLCFGFNLTGSPFPTPAGVCHCLTCVRETQPAGKVTAFGSLPSTVLYHDAAAGKQPRNTGFTAPMGWRCSFSLVPNTGLLKLEAGTQHISIVRNLCCVIPAWAVPAAAHAGPRSQHRPRWHMNTSPKPLAKPSLRHWPPDVHLSHPV